MKTFLKFILIVMVLTIADKCKAQIYFYGQDTTKVLIVAIDTTPQMVLYADGIDKYQVFGIKGYTISYKKAAIPPTQNQNGKDVIVGEAWSTFIRYYDENFRELNSNWFVISTIKR